MSLSNAEMYARRAKNGDNHEEVGSNVKRAIDELIQEIRDLEARVSILERR